MSDQNQPNAAGSDIPVPASPIIGPGPLVTPSPTLYGELATQLIADMDRFAASVPGFDDETVTADFVQSKKNISPPFVLRAIGALFGHVELQNVRSINSEAVRDDEQYVNAMLMVEQKLATVTKRVRFTRQIREARLARYALQIYGIAKELARDRETSTLKTLVDELAKFRYVRLAVARRKKPAEKPAEAPAPPAGKEGGQTAAGATAVHTKPMNC